MFRTDRVGLSFACTMDSLFSMVMREDDSLRVIEAAR